MKWYVVFLYINFVNDLVYIWHMLKNVWTDFTYSSICAVYKKFTWTVIHLFCNTTSMIKPEATRNGYFWLLYSRYKALRYIYNDPFLLWSDNWPVNPLCICFRPTSSIIQNLVTNWFLSLTSEKKWQCLKSICMNNSSTHSLAFTPFLLIHPIVFSLLW